MNHYVKGMANERKYPHVVELAVALNVKLNRQIVRFHKLRQLQPRHGRTIVMRSGLIYRWCFEDLLNARTFIEQFGGELSKTDI
jgi:hypothetical protein